MNDRLRAMLDAARSERPPSGSEQTSWEALRAAVADGRAPMVDPSVADISPLVPLLTPATGSTAATIVKIAVATALMGASAVAVMTAIRGPEAAPVATVHPELGQALPQLKPPRAPLAPPRTIELAPTEPEPPPETGSDPTEPGGRRDNKPRVRGKALPPENLSESMELLRRAWAAIKAGRHADALRLTSKHERRYPASPLAQERAASRLVALCRLGRLDTARRNLEGFRARYPDSVHEARLQRDCSAVFESKQ